MKKLFFIVLVFANLFQSTSIYPKTDKEKAYSALGIGIIIVATASYFYNRRSVTPMIQPNVADSHNQTSTQHTPISTEADETKKENSESYNKENPHFSNQTPDNQESNINNKTVDSNNSLVKTMKESLLSSLDMISSIDVNAI